VYRVLFSCCYNAVLLMWQL